MTKNDSMSCKCIGIFLMFFHHLFFSTERFMMYNINFMPFNAKIYVTIAQLFKCCVSVFVFVSSYGIAMSVSNKEKNQLFSESVSRYIKLLSGYVFIYVTSIFVGILVGRNPIKVYMDKSFGYGIKGILAIVKNMFCDFFGVSYIFDTPTYNAAWWYISFAVLLIFLVPIIVKAVDVIGGLIIPVSMLLPYLMNTKDDFGIYITTIILGIICARSQFFEKMDILKQNNKTMFNLISILSVFILLISRWFMGMEHIVDALLAMNLAVISRYIINYNNKNILTKAIVFVGKNSMNMYLIHNFIYLYFFKDFTYSLKYPILIFIFLFVSALAASIVIDEIKRYSGYNKLSRKLADKLMLKISSAFRF